MKLSKILSLIKYLVRLPQSYGFGVQSPSAYYFIKYVVNEKTPYYSYESLKNSFQDVTEKEENLYRLYFRITNYISPSIWMDFSCKSEQVGAYIKAASKDVEFLSSPKLSEIRSFDVARINVADYDLFTQLIHSLNHNNLIIVEGIYTSQEMTSFWNKIIEYDKVSVTFDLFDCGLIFFDNRNKAHYKLLLLK